MKIKRIKITNFLGINELEYSPANINIFEGPKASGKSSILESIETAVANNKRRTEVVRHGETEATLFVELDNGLEIDRRIRTDKADYLKLRKEGEGITSTEKELRQYLSGDIFRPLDFIAMEPKKQTEIILAMIKMDYTAEQINAWFGCDVLSNINTSKHLLQILKDIEVKFYNERQEINREIKTLESQVQGIEKGLPANYDGEAWKELKVQDYYNKIAEAQKINGFIQEAHNLQQSIQTKIDTINAEKNSELSKLELRYKNEESDIKDIIDLQNGKIQKANGIIEGVNQKISLMYADIEKQMNAEIVAIQKKYTELEKQRTEQIKKEAEEQQEIIQTCLQRIAAKEQEITSLSSKKQTEIESIEQSALQKIETEKARAGKAAEYLENHKPIDITPLQQEADQVAEMQSYLREWDRMLDIRNGKLADKKRYSDQLTHIIEVARTKPTELLKQHELHIEGISVDEKGLIRINGTLLDGLSEGEKLEAAFKIALQRIGELRVIFLDGFEKLNKTEQEKIFKMCADNDLQVYVTITADTENNEMIIKGE